mmetsp:Transcript_11382/g.17381  ORF Transcript_11382/g.17381 Transcript_11382/m.17381 type:complete len:235 (+) Transcript_11382:82-786(+)
MENPGWANADDGEQLAREEGQPLSSKRSSSLFSRVSFAPTMTATNTMEAETNNNSQPSYQRTFSHKLFRLLKFITAIVAVLLLIAQVISLVYLPFDGVELLLKIFLSSFCAMIILNEVEWWGILRASPLLWNWIPRGYLYAFIGLVSVEENNLKPSSGDLNTLPIDYTAALFIETASWMMFVIGVLYISLGLCCCQVYQKKVRENYKERVAERKKIFEDGLTSLEFRQNDLSMT